eukprot:CAMPEP_0118635322 /NCGR_PEP_ID=MMETSP0785-20121206/2015_1 /TAXON_ID=91992 /ORGANISM="Bolidomonas pacifica, Strain CCMP 1866" /LENGTH=397 /DNA_ID=CAMNT_0006526349 /DNA_START=135 /DNA_END=1325 /DNA_ORIENTATION=+
MSRKRVVVTGIGATSPVGNTAVESFSALLSNHSGALSLPSALPSTVACPVPEDPNPHPSVAEQKSRFISLAVAASFDALTSASLPLSFSPSSSLDKGVSIGSGIGSIAEITSAYDKLQKSHRKITPHFVPSILANSAAGVVSKVFGLKGPNVACSTACATGAHSIIDAYRFIRDSDARLMLAGGSEASIDPLSMAGFSRLRALSTNYNDSPPSASRPFDRSRDGFVMGEGASVLVLESLESALERDAPIFAEVLGYGVNGDAYHATAPDPDGNGAFRAMERALASANRSISDLDYINAHATSTPMGDEIEIKAIQQLLRDAPSPRSRPLYVSSTKGHTGHLLGAAGALEAAFAIMSLHTNTIPGTKNLTDIDVGDYDSEALKILKDGENVTGEEVNL